MSLVEILMKTGVNYSGKFYHNLKDAGLVDVDYNSREAVRPDASNKYLIYGSWKRELLIYFHLTDRVKITNPGRKYLFVQQEKYVNLI